ncbi:hypothetical protein [Flavobacterium glaciei]|uniref:Pre-mRNA-splicing factor CWC22 n=1 Tax=Flavobacterium glaciei TaxID=386300 RepID=A0A562Q1M4_9FLAO|nr:hypothetical protein [Flavobacterium glaciei]RDI57646.1 hypothetical protein DFR66_102269 [Flavobacterium glaciei]TWI50554.1 pre-mRNA-splicing factor CWC22 [Flavobacterium glaciei]
MTAHEEETNLTPESKPETTKPVRVRRAPAAKKTTPSPKTEITTENATPEIENAETPVAQTEEEITPFGTEAELTNEVVKKEKKKNKVKMKDKDKKKAKKADAKEKAKQKAKAKAKKAKKAKKDKAKKAKAKTKIKAKKAKAKSKKAKKNKKNKK